MPDDLRKRGAPDRRFIAFNQAHERLLACHVMRIDELHLALAILAIGNGRRKVKAVLKEARAMVDSLGQPKVKNAKRRPRR